MKDQPPRARRGCRSAVDSSSADGHGTGEWSCSARSRCQGYLAAVLAHGARKRVPTGSSRTRPCDVVPACDGGHGGEAGGLLVRLQDATRSWLPGSGSLNRAFRAAKGESSRASPPRRIETTPIGAPVGLGVGWIITPPEGRGERTVTIRFHRSRSRGRRASSADRGSLRDLAQLQAQAGEP